MPSASMPSAQKPAGAEGAERALSRDQPAAADAAVPTPANKGSASAAGAEFTDEDLQQDPLGNGDLLARSRQDWPGPETRLARSSPVGPDRASLDRGSWKCAGGPLQQKAGQPLSHTQGVRLLYAVAVLTGEVTELRHLQDHSGSGSSGLFPEPRASRAARVEALCTP